MTFKNILGKGTKIRPICSNSGGNNDMKIEILNPKNGRKVKLKHKIQGKAHPAGNPITVLVFSRDNKWYFQKEATWNGRHWSVDCQIGVEDTPIETEYTIVAVGSKPQPTPIETLENLPEDTLKSEPVYVVRKNN